MRLVLILALSLAAFITLGVYVGRAMHGTAGDLAAILEETESMLKQGKTEAALQSLDRFENKWSHTESLWSMLTDHREMDEINMSIKRAGSFLAGHQEALAFAELSSLRFLVGHIPEEDGVNLHTIF